MTVLFVCGVSRLIRPSGMPMASATALPNGTPDGEQQSPATGNPSSALLHRCHVRNTTRVFGTKPDDGLTQRPQADTRLPQVYNFTYNTAWLIFYRL
ncbi:MAG: hypothetical protein F6K28_06125 [Microcoleus sp. SIO2G3]|nr:hypothetical protein [Microcoleus sp. SIO2G3]